MGNQIIHSDSLDSSLEFRDSNRIFGFKSVGDKRDFQFGVLILSSYAKQFLRMTSSKACDIFIFSALFQACVNVISCKLHGCPVRVTPWESQLSKLWCWTWQFQQGFYQICQRISIFKFDTLFFQQCSRVCFEISAWDWPLWVTHFPVPSKGFKHLWENQESSGSRKDIQI